MRRQALGARAGRRRGSYPSRAACFVLELAREQLLQAGQARQLLVAHAHAHQKGPRMQGCSHNVIAPHGTGRGSLAPCVLALRERSEERNTKNERMCCVLRVKLRAKGRVSRPSPRQLLEVLLAETVRTHELEEAVQLAAAWTRPNRARRASADSAPTITRSILAHACTHSG